MVLSPWDSVWAQDNTPPQWVRARGASGDSVLYFWFDEPVADTTATKLANISLSGGFTIASITIDNAWTVGAPMPTARYSACGAVVDGKIIVMGGVNESGDVYVTETYNPVTDSWSSSSPPTLNHQGHVCGAIDNRLYLGTSGDGNVERYNPAADRWEQWGWFSWFWHPAGGVIDDKLYIVGGGDGPTPHNEVQEFYSLKQTYLDKAPMPTPRMDAASAVINGKLYVAGGEQYGSHLAVLEEYDPTLDTWTTRASLPRGISRAKAGAIDGKMYLGGGTTATGYNDTLYVYDSVSDSWASASVMPLPRDFPVIETVGNRLYIVGGEYGGTHDRVDVYNPQPGYRAVLSAGQTLPSAETALSLLTTDIADTTGNVITSSLQVDFYPSTGTTPSVYLYAPSGVQSGDVSITFVISDIERNVVDLDVEYSTDGGGSWSTATTSGTISGITASGYEGSFIWQSATDLPDQECERVKLRTIPRDNQTTSGTEHIIQFELDNAAPEWIEASGTSADSLIYFSYSEPVRDSIAISVDEYSLSEALTFQRIDLIRQWTLGDSIPSYRYGAAEAVLDGQLYVAGGYPGTSVLEVFDPGSNAWIGKASAHYDRNGGVAGALNSRFYLVGGGYAEGEYFDPATEEWYYFSKWPNPANKAAAGVINGILYVAGGEIGGGAHAEVWAYDPRTDKWSSCVSMPTARWGASAGVYQEKLYVAGGRNESSTVAAFEAYDPVADSWESLTPMPTAIMYAASGFIGQKFYVAGGYSTAYQDTVYAYDIISDTWEAVDVVTEQRQFTVSGVINDRLYITAGQNPAFYPQRLEIYDPQVGFTGSLTSGQQLPAAETAVTITAPLLTDYIGNTTNTQLDTTFYPSTGAVPGISLTSLEGIRSGDIPVPFQISDDENNLVTLNAEYSIDSGTNWSAATVSGTTTGIPSTSYQDTLIWQSRTDLAGQEFDQVWFKVTPSDNATTSGVPDSISFGLDNKPPEWIAASGSSGDTTVSFWFDEAVEESTASDLLNISISSVSGSLGIDSITKYPTWALADSIPTMRLGVAYTVFNGKLYVLGGEDGTEYINKLEVYDHVTNTWEIKAPANDGVYGATATAINGELYFYGGTLGYLAIYNPESDSWRYLDRGMETNWAASGAIRGKLYVAGGLNKSLLQQYDPHTAMWTNLSSMPTGRGWAGYGVIDGKLYVAGGFNNEYGDEEYSVLESYDPVTNSWTTNTPLPITWHSGQSAVVNGKLYLIGGMSNSVNLTSIWFYDPETDVWTEDTSLPVKRTLGAAGAIDGSIYVAAGFSDAYGYVGRTDVYNLLSHYRATLSSGTTIPCPPTQVSITASNISDLCRNMISTPLDTVFTPDTGATPSLTLTAISSTGSGDISIPFQISDDENSSVSLTAGYSSDGGLSWQLATVTGTMTDIPYSSYQDTLIWQSRTDLPGQEFDQIWFKVTPSDNATTSGVPDSISFGLDNKPPSWVAASGTAGDTTVTIWYDEPVEMNSATAISNYSLSEGLSIASIDASGGGIGEWITGPHMPTRRLGPSAGIINNRLIVVGGYLGADTNVVEAYDLTTHSWISLPSPNSLIGGGRAEVIDNQLYVLGHNASNSNILEVYEPTTNMWSMKSSMPTERDQAATGVIGGKLYVAGGASPGGSPYLDVLEAYDPETDSWASLASMPTTRGAAASGVINNKLYVAGGDDGSNGQVNWLEMYDPALNTWSTLTPMPTARRDTRGSVVQGQLYVIGGTNGLQTFDTVEIYDPATDTWTTGTPMPTDRDRMAVATQAEKIYVVGGSNYSGTYELDVFEILTVYQHEYSLQLEVGQTLPITQITLEANNIQDLYGNISSVLDTTFTPSTGNVPSLSLSSLSSTYSGDISIPFQISDDENNPISLTAGYSSDGGLSWQSATITGRTTDIPYTSYQDTLIWQSGTDIAGQEFDQIWFKVTPSDNSSTSGVPDSISFGLDNKPPEWVAAEGVAGDTTITFWFDEDVEECSATKSLSDKPPAEMT